MKKKQNASAIETLYLRPSHVNLLKMKFNYKGPLSLGAPGCRSATQQSLRSTGVAYLKNHTRPIPVDDQYVLPKYVGQPSWQLANGSWTRRRNAIEVQWVTCY